jgi:hypothetical protein
MKKHHQANDKIKAVKCEELTEEFVTYLKFHLSKVNGMKSFFLFYTKRGLIFKKKIMTIALVFESSKTKKDALGIIGNITGNFYKDRKDFIDVLPLSTDVKSEHQLFNNLRNDNIDY